MQQLSGEVMPRLSVRTMIIMLLAGIPASAAVVVTPGVYATTEAPSASVAPFTFDDYVVQYVLPASMFQSVPDGAKINGIGFRLDASQDTLATDYAFSRYDIQLGSPTATFPTLNKNFASNQAADTILVRSGPLTIAANTFTGGGSPNPFALISFSTPYIYHGQDLLVTIRKDGTSFTGLADGYVLGDRSMGNSNFSLDSSNATTGITGTFTIPVTEFSYSIPEPTGGAILMLAAARLALRRRRPF